MPTSFGLGTIDRPEQQRQLQPRRESYMGTIPWDRLLANQRTYSPEEIFGALNAFVTSPRRTSAGFLQAPTESAQLSEEDAIWNAKFPADRRQQAIQKEQAAFGTTLPSFTQQEMSSRAMTPQQRIAQAMGGGWENLDPTQRRTQLQRLAGQTPDFVNPLTGVGPTAPQVTSGGPSTINDLPAQEAIAGATRGAERSQQVAGRRQASRHDQNIQEFRKRNPKMHQDITRDVLAMYR